MGEVNQGNTFIQRDENIPEELRELRRWLPTGANKVPPTNWSDAQTWLSHVEALERRDETRSLITFLLKDSPYLVIDADHIFHAEDGKLKLDPEYRNKYSPIAEAMHTLTTVPTYREASMSLTGCHWVFDLSSYQGDLPEMKGGETYSYFFTDDHGKHAPKLELFLNCNANIVLTGMTEEAGCDPEQDIVGGDEAIEVLEYFLNLIRQQKNGGSLEEPKKDRKTVDVSSLSTDEARVLDALPYIPAENYETWVNVGMALCNEGFPIDVWDDWSKSASESYSRNNGKNGIEYKWRSFEKGDYNYRKTYIYRLAKENGWNDARNADQAQIHLYSASDLSTRELDPPQMIVDNMLGAGLYLLVAKPKMGKSFFSLQLALAVAKGSLFLNRLTTKGSVIYLALEDSPARIQNRLDLLSGDAEAPNNLFFAHECNTLTKGLEGQLQELLVNNPATRLIIVDTMQKVMPPKRGNQDSYEFSYTTLANIQRWATNKGLCVLMVHHAKKGVSESGDPFDQILGSTGLKGSSDGALMLAKNRGEEHFSLAIQSRDFEEETLSLDRDKDTGGWISLGNADEVGFNDRLNQFRSNRMMRTIIDLVREGGGSIEITAKELAEETWKRGGDEWYLSLETRALSKAVSKYDDLLLSEAGIRHKKPAGSITRDGKKVRLHCFRYETIEEHLDSL